jgi:hypothetical protein
MHGEQSHTSGVVLTHGLIADNCAVRCAYLLSVPSVIPHLLAARNTLRIGCSSACLHVNKNKGPTTNKHYDLKKIG